MNETLQTELQSIGINCQPDLEIDGISTNPSRPTRFSTNPSKKGDDSGWAILFNNPDGSKVIKAGCYRENAEGSIVIKKGGSTFKKKTVLERYAEAATLNKVSTQAAGFKYLINRGFKESVIRQISDDVRFLDGVGYYKKSENGYDLITTESVIASKIKNDNLQSWHQIYCDKNGEKPAAIGSKNRKIKNVDGGEISGCSILVCEAIDSEAGLAVAEGVESALALRQLGFQGEIRALTSTSIFKTFIAKQDTIYLASEGETASKNALHAFYTNNSDKNVFVWDFGQETDANDAILKGVTELPTAVTYMQFKQPKFNPDKVEEQADEVLDDEMNLAQLIVPIGRVTGGKLAVYSGFSKEMVVFSASDLNKNNLDLTFGRTNLLTYFYIEARNGLKVDYEAVADYVIEKCTEQGFFDPSRVRGLGLWEEGDKHIFNGKTCVSLSQEGDFEQANRLGKKYIYGAGSAFDLSKDLASESDLKEVIKGVNSFTYKRDSDPLYAAGWLVQAVLAGTLKWRSHIYMNAEHGAGKTTFTKFADKMVGFGVRASGDSVSAAGIRQKVAASCAPVILDEMEGGQGNITAMLNLARTASAGDVSIKGSQSQTAVEFNIKSAFFFASIAAPALNAADASRFVQIDIIKDKNKPFTESIIQEKESVQEALGELFVAYVLKHSHEILDVIADVNKALVKSGLEARTADTLSALLGSYKAVFGKEMTVEKLIEEANVTKYFEAKDDKKGGDTELVIDKMLQSTTRFKMDEVTLAELVQLADENIEAKKTIQRKGLSTKQDKGVSYLVIAKNNSALNDVFKSTQYANGAYANTILKSCAECSEKVVKFAALGKSVRCIMVPFTAIFNDDEIVTPSKPFDNRS